MTCSNNTYQRYSRKRAINGWFSKEHFTEGPGIGLDLKELEPGEKFTFSEEN